MDAKFFVGHLQYSRWATFANLDAAGKLTEDELHRRMGDSFQGVLGTLIHMFRADRVWLERLRGHGGAPMIPPGETFTLAELRDLWGKLFDDYEKEIGGYREEDLKAEIRFMSVVKQ